MRSRRVHGLVPVFLFLCLCLCLLKADDFSPLSEHDATLQSQYLSYLSAHGKSSLRAADPRRLQRFRRSLQLIEAHAQAAPRLGLHFRLGLNDFADWTADELAGLFSSADAPQPARPLLLEAAKAPSTPLNASASTSTDSATPRPSSSLASLNWASPNNRLGASIVPPVRNQGVCGACWAFVAVAAVEASVRLCAHTSMALPLSAQELIDCDTAFNRGCLGGNPLYAFEYTMVMGLTSLSDYPYREKVGTCLRKHLKSRAAIAGFLRIQSSDQQALGQALLSAPVAVGICGTDQSFVYYAGGILDTPQCCTVQNHALLVVGTGALCFCRLLRVCVCVCMCVCVYECVFIPLLPLLKQPALPHSLPPPSSPLLPPTPPTGRDESSGLDYWVAQNSWGQGWGEKGYIRLLRTHDTNSTGQCGLATSPCVAEGGFPMGGAAGEGGVDAEAGGFSPLDLDKRAAVVFAWWWEANWRDALLGGSVALFCVSVWLLLWDGEEVFTCLRRGGR